nr:DUF4232 domain-containing protein [Kibdelosporangium sp. MJ126-NF4]CEL22281.1 hypothetical protein [Kibdelosporangium sp. MJ126-NF4]CTQ93063.1 hypothetical protein [Kibdelosporangium sp. MJ126-NF4]
MIRTMLVAVGAAAVLAPVVATTAAAAPVPGNCTANDVRFEMVKDQNELANRHAHVNILSNGATCALQGHIGNLALVSNGQATPVNVTAQGSGALATVRPGKGASFKLHYATGVDPQVRATALRFTLPGDGSTTEVAWNGDPVNSAALRIEPVQN